MKTTYICTNPGCEYLRTNGSHYEAKSREACPYCRTPMVEATLEALQKKSVQNNEQTGDELFQVVDESVVRFAEEHKPREARTLENSNPTTEAVNARLKMSFMCRACGELHYPKSYVPEKCLYSLPTNVRVDFNVQDSFLLYAGAKPKTPPQAANVTTEPPGRDEKMIALADIDGYIERKREEVVRARENALEQWAKMPFDDDLKFRGSTKDDEGDAPGEQPDVLTHKGIYSVYMGKNWISTGGFLNLWYPIHEIITIGASVETLIDIARDGQTILLHYHSAMIPPQKPRPKYEEAYKDSPKLVLFHEHFLMRNTNRITRDCEVWQVSTKASSIANALKEIDGKRARQVR